MKIGFQIKLLGALLLLIPLMGEFLIERETHMEFDGFGFYAWFGFGACLTLVLIALLIGRVLKRRDDYYDD